MGTEEEVFEETFPDEPSPLPGGVLASEFRDNQGLPVTNSTPYSEPSAIIPPRTEDSDSDDDEASDAGGEAGDDTDAASHRFAAPLPPVSATNPFAKAHPQVPA